MNKHFTFLVLLLSVFTLGHAQKGEPEWERDNDEGTTFVLDSNDHSHGGYRHLHGAAREAEEFAHLYKSDEDRLRIIESLVRFRSETDFGIRSNDSGWISVGPGYAYSDPPTHWNIRINTGRAVDVEWTQLGGLRVLSASGGLFISECAPPCADTFPDFSFSWRCISDNLNTLRGGAFATNPLNPSTIFLGTGEYGIQGGTGLYITHDLGLHWQQAPVTPSANDYFKIAFDPIDTNVIHCGTSNGYYISTNGGQTFTRKMTGVITDVLLNPHNPSTLYIVKIGSGYFRSYDKGNTWNLIPGAPNQDIGRSQIDMCLSDTNVLFTTATTKSSGYSGNKWFFRSLDNGNTWDSCHMIWNCSTPQCYNIYDNQSWYNNALGIDPTECGTVLAGAVALTVGYTDSINTNFQMQGLMSNGDEHHPDQHDIAWQTTTNPPIAWLANDGGIAYAPYPYIEFEGGKANNLPIFQILDFGLVDNVIKTKAIGTQDNKSIVYNDDNGFIWQEVWGGDGFSVAINPAMPSQVLMVNNSALLLTENGGIDYSFLSTPFYPRHVRFGSADNGKVYLCGIENDQSTEYDHCIYEADFNMLFHPTNPFPFSQFIQNFAIGQGVVPNIYVSLWPNENEYATADKLMIRDRVDDTWYERSSGLNVDDRVENVVPDRVDPDIALLFMNNEHSRSEFNNIYFTTNRGQTWTNITGDLPDVRIRAGLIYPYDRNIIILGSIDGGCFITTNGGQNWIRWNKGMPQANIIREFQVIDSVATDNKFWIYAATYGRSLWLREISDSGFPTGMNNADNKSVPELFASFTATGDLSVDYMLQASAYTSLQLYTINGASIFNATFALQPKGVFHHTLPLANIAAGVYVLRLSTSLGDRTIKVLKN